MTTTRWRSASAAKRQVGDVVAGLVNDDSAQAVARAAVREAVARGARVRFLQVVGGGSTPEERAASDEATFTAALRALREAPRLPVTFEVVDGEVAPTFVLRSAGASVLVVGRDSGEPVADVAGYCQSHCSCDVLTVSGTSRPVG